MLEKTKSRQCAQQQFADLMTGETGDVCDGTKMSMRYMGAAEGRSECGGRRAQEARGAQAKLWLRQGGGTNLVMYLTGVVSIRLWNVQQKNGYLLSTRADLAPHSRKHRRVPKPQHAPLVGTGSRQICTADRTFSIAGALYHKVTRILMGKVQEIGELWPHRSQ
jgi:hypothetical protein